MKIYDSFMYFDEDLLLDLRLNVLDKYVSKFIITEACLETLLAESWEASELFDI